MQIEKYVLFFSKAILKELMIMIDTQMCVNYTNTIYTLNLKQKVTVQISRSY